MTTFEWLSLIGVLISGFGAVVHKLSVMERAIDKRVSYEECHVRRDQCPCIIERNDRIRDDLTRTRELINHKEVKNE